MFSPFDQAMFTIVPVIVMIGFVVIISVFIMAAIKGAKQWKYNNAQPVLTVEAKVISKRMDISRHNHSHDDNIHHHTSTTYYVAFEVKSGDRMEFHVSGQEYGLLVENDTGELTFQGTRYLGFNRGK
jgi:hypothetical protein